MQRTRRLFARLWSTERGIASVEYVLLLAIIGSALIMGATLLGSAVSSELFEAALWFGDTVGNNCGTEGGAGSGGGNTCQ